MLVIDDYGEGEERGWKCGKWKEKRENYDKWLSSERNEIMTLWDKWFNVWVSIYIKVVINWFFTFETSLGMDSYG